MSSEETMDHMFCFSPIFACIALTCTYVASLYVWRSSLNRDHPETIKRRFFSVTCMMLVAPAFTYYFLSSDRSNDGELYAQLGLRWAGLVNATVLPLFLTVILFLGPLTMQFFSGVWKLYSDPLYWISSWRDLVWIRNHVVAPLSEEWVFRACMMPLLLQCLQPITAVFVGPLLFGIAHFHHLLEQLKGGFNFKTALAITTFQFIYTSIFGAYSSYLFVRTGHFVAPLMAHTFCNHMGFPNLADIPEHRPWHQVVIVFNFFLGFTLWYLFLVPITDPEYYDNKLHWVT